MAQREAHMNEPAKIAVIGDLHGSWDDWDVAYFNASDYELLLFTGDLGSGTGEAGVKIARSIARLAKPALVMPGNNDVAFQPAIAAEFAHQRGLIELLAVGPRTRSRALGASSGQVELCGYSLHPLSLGGRDLTLLAGRPNALGGHELSFPEHIERNYAISSMEASRERLTALVADAPTEELIVLSHNGPAGLGAEPTDLWGCDFREGAGDWGDPDLAAALGTAPARGKRVLAVIGGHMHLKTRTGAERVPKLERDGTLYLNPARVPRIQGGRTGVRRSHVCMEIDADGIRASEVVVDSGV
jgi:uncharacterized protein (TIGR04168 family)